VKTSRNLWIAAGLSEAVRLSGWRASLALRAESLAPPQAIAPLVREVEQEPWLVPGVRHVVVRARSAEGSDLTLSSPDGWVCYEVDGIAAGVPWRVRFRKAWEGDERFWWRSEGGTGRPEQHGALWLLPHGSGARLELRARTRSALPVLGGAATLLVNPLFLAPTFSRWLRNLARAAERA
jgi:hypothetical protein